MSENLRKLIGVAVMAAIVVVGVVATNGDDSDFARTRNVAFGLPKGAGLDAQVQQPGDAENDLVIAMAAAAKCDEGHVLISTGDPIEPWRCGPLLIELATVAEEASRATPWDSSAVLGRPCQHAFIATDNLEGQSSWLYQDPVPEEILLTSYALWQAMECLASWSSGHSVEDVDREIDSWWRGITDHACPGWPRPEALSTNGIVYWINFRAACPGGWNPLFDLNP